MNLNRAEVQAMIDQSVAKVYKNVGQILTAQGNYAAMSDYAPGNPGAAPASYLFAAIALTAQVSGIFQVMWDVQWTDNTSGDTLTFILRSNTPTVQGQATGLTQQQGPVGFAGANVGPAVGGLAPGAYIPAVAGTSMLVSIPGGGLTSKVQYQLAQPSLTGELTGQWSGAMICDNTTAVAQKTPFTTGNNVIFGLYVSAADTVSIAQMSFSAIELAAQ